MEWPRDAEGKRLRGTKLLRALFAQALKENSSPPQVAFSVAAGVFAGFTPFIGFHIWIALAVATVCRLNRLWAALASHTSPLPVFVWAAFCEIELGHWLRARTWIPLSPHDAFVQRQQLFGDWLLGSVLFAGVLAALAGFVAYALARRWHARRAASVTQRTPDGSLPPSSGSRPSAPPAPTA